MSEALRFNNDKPMLSYFMRSFPKMAEAVARVKEMGAIKYNDGNWRLGNKPDEEYWNSMFRHLNYIFGGEDYDKDTGCLHIAHAVWNLCALLELNYPDMPARDDEIWAERAIHWAEEKKKREAKEEPEPIGLFDDYTTDDMLDAMFGPGVDLPPIPRTEDEVYDELFGPEVDLPSTPRTEKQESVGTVEREACWAADAARRERDAVDAAVYAGIFNIHSWNVVSHHDECPKCGCCSVALKGRDGKECTACGEIFGLPIVPENPLSSSFAKLIAQYFAPALRWTEDKIVQRSDAADASDAAGYAGREGDKAEEKQKRNDFVDAAVYSDACVERIMEGLMPKECPQCGSMRTSQDGERGILCLDCGEAFEVPIVPENTPLYKNVKFIIRDAKPSSSFKALMDKIFKINLGGCDGRRSEN